MPIRPGVHDTDLPLVPPARLAVLLTAKRREGGLDLADLSRRSDQRYSPAMLDEFEKGRAPLDEKTLRDLVWVYGLKSEVSLPSRSKLILDLDARHIGVGDTAIPFESSTADVVLERYVSLLYLLRNEKPGRQLSLRDDDLDVLGSTLDLTISALTTELSAIMGAASTNQRTSRLGRHLTLGAAGLLVGVTTVGSLIIVGMPGGGDAAPVADNGSEPAAVLASHDGLHRSGGGGGVVLAGATNDTPRSGIVLSSSTESAQAAASTEPTESTQAAEPLADVEVERAPKISIPSADLVTEDAAVEEAATEEATVEEVTAELVLDTAQPDHDHVHADHDHPAEVTEASPVAAASSPGAEASAAVIDLAAIESHLGRDLNALVPGWTIELHGDLSGYRGQTNWQDRTISVFLDHGDTVASVAEILTHEIGHAIDLDQLDTEARLQWVEMRGMPQVWWTGNGLSDFAVGAGDFAEAVAAVLSGSPSNSHYGSFTAEQLAFVSQFVG